MRTTTSEEVADIYWINDEFYRNQPGSIKIPYSTKSGTFFSPTLEGNNNKAKNALWDIEVKFLRTVDELMSTTARMASPANLAVGNTVLPYDSLHTDDFLGILFFDESSFPRFFSSIWQ